MGFPGFSFPRPLGPQIQFAYITTMLMASEHRKIILGVATPSQYVATKSQTPRQASRQTGVDPCGPYHELSPGFICALRRALLPSACLRPEPSKQACWNLRVPPGLRQRFRLAVRVPQLAQSAQWAPPRSLLDPAPPRHSQDAALTPRSS